jgi:hypothetical protein
LKNVFWSRKKVLFQKEQAAVSKNVAEAYSKVAEEYTNASLQSLANFTSYSNGNISDTDKEIKAASPRMRSNLCKKTKTNEKQ